jgi:hypothetical protein
MVYKITWLPEAEDTYLAIMNICKKNGQTKKLLNFLQG